MMTRRSILLLIPVLLLVGLLVRGFSSKIGLGSSPHRNGSYAWPSCGQAAIGTVEKGVIARSADSETPAPIASMAKLITAMAILERQPLSPGQAGPTYTIAAKDIESMNTYIADGGSALPMFIGMKVTEYQALQRMLIASDNNMADVLAERVFGSTDGYISYARDMLNRMGLHHTTVADASGFCSSTVGTPSDMIAIGIAALRDAVIAGIVARQHARLPAAGVITNTNQLLGIDGVIGIKTGTTSEAGSCLLFAAPYASNNKQKGIIVGVVMGDRNHRRLYADCKDLLASAKMALQANHEKPK
ncbi:MAG TPA: hypothetical protein VMH27_06520 [Puia sp.]|nr:hypothetical protein [Puia sp.]